jgi:hypothetical protein
MCVGAVHVYVYVCICVHEQCCVYVYVTRLTPCWINSLWSECEQLGVVQRCLCSCPLALARCPATTQCPQYRSVNLACNILQL